jgi:allantoate deiminase/N-carbamoyl-L-amino-acid hydrolase
MTETNVEPSSGTPHFGERILALADRLATFSETPDGLTCTFLSPAHRAVASELAVLMKAAGMAVEIDAVANVVGRYRSDNPNARTLIVGSHYDTVRNAGKYDGRLGILTALVVVEELARQGRRPPFHLEVIAFSEEEGVRFSASYIGSSAVAGRFDPATLQRRDGGGMPLGEAIQESGFDPAAIPGLARRGDALAGYLEVHIEQGPVLLDAGVPVGVVTGIAGNVRRAVTVEGEAGHAGTVPMGLRHDALAAAAEIVLLVERRCGKPGLVGTVGRLFVPNAAINVIPRRCEFTLDIRSGDDALRDAAVADITTEMQTIAERRGVTVTSKELLRAPAVPCSPGLQNELAVAIERAGLPVRHLPSGAGHDAVMFDGVTDIGMLFVRCGNGGVSHSPLETITAADADTGARVLLDVLTHMKPPA